MCLLQKLYRLSDYEVEDQVNDRISFRRFVGLIMNDTCPDHSIISQFSTILTEKSAYKKVFKVLNKQLEKHKIIVKTGAIVDASVTDCPRKPKGKAEYAVVVDRHKDDGQVPEQPIPPTLAKKEKFGVDPDCWWIKKTGKLRFGFKQHATTDERGVVLVVIINEVNESDIKHLDDVLEVADLPAKAFVKTDKGYNDKDNDEANAAQPPENKVTKSWQLNGRE